MQRVAKSEISKDCFCCSVLSSLISLSDILKIITIEQPQQLSARHQLISISSGQSISLYIIHLILVSSPALLFLYVQFLSKTCKKRHRAHTACGNRVEQLACLTLIRHATRPTGRTSLASKFRQRIIRHD